MTEKPLLMQGAMAVEVARLLELTEGAHTESIGGYEFTHGLLNGAPVIISRTLIGSAHTGAATAIALTRYSPRAVLNQGTAGAHSLELHTGDIVLGERVVRMGAYRSERTPRGAGIDPARWTPLAAGIERNGQSCNIYELPSAPRLVSIARAAAEACADSIAPRRIVCGTIASGDTWNREYDMIERLVSTHATDCEEMEAFAAAQTCAMFDLPFLALRIISNNERLGERYWPEVCSALQDFVAGLVARI